MPGSFGTSSTTDGADATTASSASSGIFANNTATTPAPAGTPGGNGVFGLSTVPNASGVFGANNNGGIGVSGNSATGDGMRATTGSSANSGIYANNTATTPAPAGTPGGNGVFGLSTVPNASGVFGANNNGGTGVSGVSSSGVGIFGVGGKLAGEFDGNVQVTGTLNSTGPDYGVVGNATGTGTGVMGYSGPTGGTGVAGHSSGGGVGVFGFIDPIPGSTPPGGITLPVTAPENPAYLGVAGVIGETVGPNQWGVLGVSEGSAGIGVAGVATGGNGASGVNGYCHGTTGGNGVSGICDTGNGVYGETNDPSQNYAGYFKGNVSVTGTLLKAAGGFLIDHPLDPVRRHLCHSFVESSDMMNIYAGNVVLNAQGEGYIQLPAWFEALNMDFRYQLTCIGVFAAIYVVEEIVDGKFKIAGGAPGMKVSWQVTGTRNDRYARDHRLAVEIDKSPADATVNGIRHEGSRTSKNGCAIAETVR
jgi:hypothetical protein